MLLWAESSLKRPNSGEARDVNLIFLKSCLTNVLGREMTLALAKTFKASCGSPFTQPIGSFTRKDTPRNTLHFPEHTISQSQSPVGSPCSGIISANGRLSADAEAAWDSRKRYAMAEEGTLCSKGLLVTTSRGLGTVTTAGGSERYTSCMQDIRAV